MKRFITMIVAVCAFFAVSAHNQTATLSHEGELTTFTGMLSLRDALINAVDGDIIYLSEGEFVADKSIDSPLYMDKLITIIGCGYKSNIISRVYITTPSSYTVSQNIMVLFDGVHLNQIDFNMNHSMLQFYKHLAIRNCWINALNYIGYAGERLDIDRCLIDFLGDFGNAGKNTVNISNSKIVNDCGIYHTNVYNCNIKSCQMLPQLIESSIVEDYPNDSYYHILNNCLLSKEPVYDTFIKHNCYYENPTNGLLDENLNATIDLKAKGYIDIDGNIIGAYGGTHPFSEYPSVPTVDSEKSSVEYDPSTNKLNVTITVAPN